MGTVEEEPLKTSKTQTIELKEKTWKEKIQYVKENITLEPVLTCYVIPGTISRLATQNLNLDKACRVNKNFGEEVCNALLARQGNKYINEELEVQELIAAMESWKNVLLTAIPSFLILFLGAWSDRTKKRKLCILLPIFGELLACVSNILNAYFFYELPVEVTMFFEALFPAITGSWAATYMGAFSYISDISSEESRTFRVGVANLCLTAGGPIGAALSGILLEKIGYYGVFSISSVLYGCSIAYGYFYITDPEGNNEKDSVQNEPKGVWNSLKTFFDLQHVKNTLEVAFKKGPNHRRTKSILVLLSIGFIYGPTYGEFTMRYLFTRYRFNWDAVMYSLFSTCHILTHALGALISISVFSRRLKWHDSVLGLISTTSKIIGGVCTGFARNSMEMYIAVIIESFNATSFTALRSISSKLVTKDELGKMTSLFNLMEILTSMVFGPIYSSVYKWTVKTDASVMYYMSTVLTIPPILIFVWFFMEHRSTVRKEKSGKAEESQKELEKLEKNSASENKDEFFFSSIEIDLPD
ncbi:proton-coupled folate transporter-like [Plodia interpunctella]|uniref:proton-coupled folate transporter-like n=1 Tax=Plodia interpunctella TaxID=58824 RepID=UPI002367961D|nr:proton-coupled folate transporter-like [Plodia interpunctella]